MKQKIQERHFRWIWSLLCVLVAAGMADAQERAPDSLRRLEASVAALPEDGPERQPHGVQEGDVPAGPGERGMIVWSICIYQNTQTKFR